MTSLLQQRALQSTSTRTCRSVLHQKQCHYSGQARQHRLACRAIAQDSENGVKAAAAAKKSPAAPAANRPFTNTQRFQVPQECVRLFEDEWQRRAADMKAYEGFQGFSINREGGTYVVSSSWSSIPQWEAYNLGPEIRRSHLPYGIYQYVPGKGEGFPEDFVPFLEFVKAVDAKY